MKTQHELEYAIHQNLDANEPVTVRAFAEYAAGEVDDLIVADLLAAIHVMGQEDWERFLQRLNGSLQQCMRDLAKSLDKQRAAFMEWEAQRLTKEAETADVVRSEMQ